MDENPNTWGCWMLFILGSSSVDASEPVHFFCVWASFVGGWGYGSIILVPLKKTWGILDSGIAVHSYTGIQMWMSWTMGLQSIAQTKRRSVKVKQGRHRRKGRGHEAQACSTQS